MKIFNLVIKSITQRFIKVLFVFLGITIGVSTIVAVYNITESMKVNMSDQANFKGPDIIVTPNYKGVTMSYGGITLPEIVYDTDKLTGEDLKNINSLPSRNHMKIVSPKISGVATASTGGGYVVNGVVAKEEFSLYPWIIENIAVEYAMDELLTQENIIIGQKVADELGIKQGDFLKLNEASFFVLHIAQQTGGAEDSQIYMSLENAEKTLNRSNSFSSIEITFDKSLVSENTLINEINRAIPQARIISPIRDALLQNEMLGRFTAFGFALSILVFVAGTLMVTITVLGSVKEKTKEIGIFRALGFKKKQIALMILIESGIISLFAGIMGFLTGNLMTLAASNYFSYMSTVQTLNIVLLIPVVILSVISGVISSVYPAIKGANLNPIDAMRFI